MGKPAGQDLAEGKITLPLILSLKNSSRKDKEDIFKRLDTATEADFAYINTFIKSCEGVRLAGEYEKKIADEALQSLSFFPPGPPAAILRELVSADLQRQK